MENNIDRKVETSREFQVSVEKLYSAWNDAEELKQWWKPLGNKLETIENELREGGNVRYIFTSGALVISGTYDKVQPNEKLIYSWNWEFPNDDTKNASYQLEIQFSAKNDGSEIHIRQTSLHAEERLHPNEHGWEQGLTDLASYLQNRSANTQSNDVTPSHSKVGEPGYRESPDQQKVGG